MPTTIASKSRDIAERVKLRYKDAVQGKFSPNEAGWAGAERERRSLQRGKEDLAAGACAITQHNGRATKDRPVPTCVCQRGVEPYAGTGGKCHRIVVYRAGMTIVSQDIPFCAI